MQGELIAGYRKHTAKKAIVLVALCCIAVLLTAVCIFVGSSGISFWEVVKALFGAGEEVNIRIVWNIRFPRVLAAIVAGGGLAVSGCIMQNVLKNPMASPSTLGVGNASVFGANFAIIVLGAGSFHSTHGNWLTLDNPYVVTICSFVFALLCVGVILLLSAYKRFTPPTIVLAGVAIGSIFQAATTILQYFAIDYQVSSAVYWTFGDLGRATYGEDLIMAIVVVCSFAYFFFKRWDYCAMSNGMAFAKSVGVKTQSVTVVSLFLASLITAVCVSFLGIIGFIGLIAPQIMKRIIGDDYRFLLPCSFACGTCILLVSDTVGRLVIAGTSLPVGAITSLLGGPLFLMLLLKEKKHVSRR